MSSMLGISFPLLFSLGQRSADRPCMIVTEADDSTPSQMEVHHTDTPKHRNNPSNGGSEIVREKRVRFKRSRSPTLGIADVGIDEKDEKDADVPSTTNRELKKVKWEEDCPSLSSRVHDEEPPNAASTDVGVKEEESGNETDGFARRARDVVQELDYPSDFDSESEYEYDDETFDLAAGWPTTARAPAPAPQQTATGRASITGSIFDAISEAVTRSFPIGAPGDWLLDAVVSRHSGLLVTVQGSLSTRSSAGWYDGQYEGAKGIVLSVFNTGPSNRESPSTARVKFQRPLDPDMDVVVVPVSLLLPVHPSAPKQTAVIIGGMYNGEVAQVREEVSGGWFVSAAYEHFEVDTEFLVRLLPVDD
ncbi:hypothetical protein C8Q80DRAFT_415764 [Daedaleopsis nitida]|nr:hypothetical protein C8Q80DRAFT_415764 [Daedaleopsis nitida]